jgi:hypothetical protein
MPPGLIEEENSVSARSDFGCDLIEMKLHGLAPSFVTTADA